MRDGHEDEVLSQGGSERERGQMLNDIRMSANEGDKLEQLAGDQNGGAQNGDRPQVHFEHHRVRLCGALGAHPVLNGACDAV